MSTLHADLRNARVLHRVIPGLATPWPPHRRWPVTRRLLALWRWEAERGEDSDAARNARTSLRNRIAKLGVDIT